MPVLPAVFTTAGAARAEHQWFDRLDPEQADIEVDKMLGRLTAPEFGDYERWLKISMAAYRAGASLATWDAWCRQLPGYDQAENWAKWDSGTLAMDREDGITVGTLICSLAARLHGRHTTPGRPARRSPASRAATAPKSSPNSTPGSCAAWPSGGCSDDQAQAERPRPHRDRPHPPARPGRPAGRPRRALHALRHPLAGPHRQPGRVLRRDRQPLRPARRATQPHRPEPLRRHHRRHRLGQGDRAAPRHSDRRVAAASRSRASPAPRACTARWPRSARISPTPRPVCSRKTSGAAPCSRSRPTTAAGTSAAS